MEFAKPQQQHQWLQQLVGDWEYTMTAVMGEDGAEETHKGTETVSSLGGLWIVGEGTCPGTEDGATGVNILTLGYDPAQSAFIGTWVGSMMTNMWVYRGQLDSTGKILTLDTTGPSWTDPTKTQAYRDIVEVVDANTRYLRSETQQEDGTWNRFMTSKYTRKS